MTQTYAAHATRRLFLAVGMMSIGVIAARPAPASPAVAAGDAFGIWAKARYGDLDALNRAWETEFWSDRFVAFDQLSLRDDANARCRADYAAFAAEQRA